MDMGSLARANIKSLEYINFGADGYRDRYYTLKFATELKSKTYSKLDTLVKRVDMEYFRALSWIQHYYYGGIASWTWFYPFHYAPMVSDLAKMKVPNVSSQDLWPIDKRGGPLTPLTQLSLLMPRNSARGVIPKPYFDAIFGSNSAVRQYYPEEFVMDLNGKLWNWEAIALMPHVDVETLQKVLDSKEGQLTAECKQRNKLGHHHLYIQEKDESFKNYMVHRWGCPKVEGGL